MNVAATGRKSFDHENIPMLYRSCIVKTLQCTVKVSRNLFTGIYIGEFLEYFDAVVN
jgi:hypothetical protein